MVSRLKKAGQRTLLAADAIQMALDPELSASYYPDAPRKGRLEIALESAAWAFRHGEVPANYFTYGLDRKGTRPSNYVAHSQAMRLISVRNRRMAGGQGPGEFPKILKDKRAFAELAERLGYPTPRNLAYVDDQGIEWVNPPRKTPLVDLVEEEGLDSFWKPVGGGGGKGAFALCVRGGRLFINGGEVTVDALRSQLSGQMMVQERIHQHEALSALHPVSINTVRLITALSGGEARPFAAAQRIGVHGAPMDNWATGGIIVRVDLDEGVLRGRGFFKYGKGASASHPDTGILFDGYRLPGLKEGVELACRFHEDIGRMHTIGWDLAITTLGPVIVEGNTFWNEGIHHAVDDSFGPRLLTLEPLERARVYLQSAGDTSKPAGYLRQSPVTHTLNA